LPTCPCIQEEAASASRLPSFAQVPEAMIAIMKPAIVRAVETTESQANASSLVIPFRFMINLIAKNFLWNIILDEMFCKIFQKN
jgi:hypothetical protein